MKITFFVGDNQIEFNESYKARYLFLATESELLVNRQLVCKSGGFNLNEKLQGEFNDSNDKEHSIEIETNTVIGKTIYFYYDKKLIFSKTETTAQFILGCMGILTILCFIFLIIIVFLLII